MYKYKRIKIGKNKTRDEHRIVMEEFLDRPLLRNEVVHHINDDGKDNRIENLELMTREEHSRMHEIGKPNYKARKLSKDDVVVIRNSNLSDSKLAEQFKVADETIRCIKTYKTYKEF